MLMFKVWAISDTHGQHKNLVVPEEVDIVVCSGDVSNDIEPSINQHEFIDFLEWYTNLDIEYKILVGGNHDTALWRRLVTPEEIKSKGIIYLEHEEFILNRSGRKFKFFGSPYTPSFGREGWAWNVKRTKIDKYWRYIPLDTNYLITHGPPKSILDLTIDYNHNLEQVGDKALLNTTKELKSLEVHQFGHLHNKRSFINAGQFIPADSRTKYINASCVDIKHNLVNNGQIITI